jgi:hypothetical protein
VKNPKSGYQLYRGQGKRAYLVLYRKANAKQGQDCEAKNPAGVMIFFYGFPGWGSLRTLSEEIFASEIFAPWGKTLRQAGASHFSGFCFLGLDIYWEILELGDQFSLSAISQI